MKHRHIYFAAAFLLLLLICTAYNLRAAVKRVVVDYISSCAKRQIMC